MILPVMALVLLPFGAALATAPIGAALGRRVHWWAIAVAATCLALTLVLYPFVWAGEPLVVQATWVPLLGIDFSFYIDGLSLLFALVISGVGTLVLIYARSYIEPSEDRVRFYSSMLFFMGSMLGVVLAGNLIMIFIFWELTSVSSYLLIGFWDRVEGTRRAATQALLVTAGGGLAMLAGLIIIYLIVGTFDLATVLSSRDAIVTSSWYTAALILVLLGAFTKSAQFPFHFWLPGAMVAPTPVSTYLHSATMVKAGLFLLARLYPALGGTAEWILIVTTTGAVTMLVGGYIALKQTDLKALLAYSTVSQLGLITMLYGLSTEESVAAGTFHLFNHSLFKGALFMIAGYVEHEMGSRDLRQLGGLARRMPHAMVVTGIAALALAGIPPLNGFLSKEMFFEATLHPPFAGFGAWLLPVVAVVGSIFTFLYAMRFWHGTFFGQATHPHLEPHAPAVGFLASPGFLAALCVLVGLYAAPAERLVIEPAVAGVLGEALDLHIQLWHGFNLPLLMSGLVIALGLLAFSRYSQIVAWQERHEERITAGGLYDAFYEFLLHGTPRIYARVQNGSLRHYLVVVISGMLGLVGVVTLATELPPLQIALVNIDVYEYLLPVLLILSTLATVLFGERLAAIIALGMVGVGVSFTFVLYSAPDLALTQLLIEIVSIVLFIFVFTRALPMRMVSLRPGRLPLFELAVSVGTGVLVTFLMLFVLSGRLYPSIADYYIQNTQSLTGGLNVVNIIIVDFRGYDTLFEITVLSIAALGLYSLIKLRLGRGR